MATYTYIGGPLDDPNSYTVGGMTPMNPPGASDTIDFASGGSPTGSADVSFVTVEGAVTLTGDLTTDGMYATAAVMINAGGDLDSTSDILMTDVVTVKNGGQLEADFATFEGPTFTVDGSGSSYTDQGDFLAEGPTTVTFSNGAQVQTGGDPGDTDVIDGGSFTVTTGAMLTASAIATADGMTWTFDQNATLTLTGGGNLAEGGAVGADLNGTGTIDNATINSEGGWAIGGSGLGIGATGVATFKDNANVTVASLYLGDYSGDNGMLTVSGAGTVVNVEGNTSIASSAGLLLIGNSGTGDLTINQGSTVIDTITSTLADSTVGYDVDSTGTVVVDGDTTSWRTIGTLDVGGDGFGQVTVQNKAAMTATQLDVAEQSDSGTAAAPDLVTITGAGSSLTVADELNVGAAGVGALTIAAGGTVTISSSGSTALVVGDTAMAVGTVIVTGTGSVLTTEGTAIVGNGGLGTLDIGNQGSAMLGALMVAAMSTSGTTSNPDMVTVNGSGSTLVVTGTATVDSAMPTGFTGGSWNYTASGDGEIAVSKGGYMSIGHTLSLQAPSADMTPPVLMVVSGGGVEVGGNSGLIADTLYIDNGGIVVGHGTIASINSSTNPALPTWSLNVVDNGILEASKGLLTIDANITANGTVQIDNDATLELGGAFAQGGTVTFADKDQHTLILDDPTEFNGAINGIAPGDQIIIPNSALTNGASVIAAPIVQMDGTQTLLIYEGMSIVPTVVLPNIPIEGTAGGNDLANDYFQITQDGSNTVLTLMAGNQPGFIINSGYSDTVATLGTADPALQMNFEIGVETAVLFYQSEITNTMTANITFGWGDAGPEPVTGNFVGRSYWYYNSYTYAQVRAAFAATYAGSAVQNAALASLPVTDPTHNSTFGLTFVQQKALGLLGATTSADGYVGLNSSDGYFWNQGTPVGGFDAVGDLEHEISEVMGRNAEAGAASGAPLQSLDLFRYTAADGGATDAPGTAVGERDEPFTPDWVGGAGMLMPGQAGINANSYFSFNGTSVTLPFDTPADVAAGDDVGDWGPSVLGDSYGSFSQNTLARVSNTDLQVLNVLGYNIPNVMACFAAGTHILTDRGEIAVQNLRPGDPVRTRISDDLTPIVWIGHRRVNCARHPDPRKVWPVLVRAGAFDDAKPHRDLWLSPDHAVYVNEVLIPIKHLINGISILQIAMDEIVYHHIELPRHDVLLAEGLAAESWLDTGNRDSFDNAGTAIRLHADFARPRIRGADVWESAGCAPMIVAGAIVEQTRRHLNRRARSRPAPLRGRPVKSLTSLPCSAELTGTTVRSVV